ncbi:flagellar hook-associated protein 2 [Sporolactobacillus sp. THM19-2]|uniref:flagellar hook-associated protein 2 n=1 Tax=Sporolactobacillus sp. THM19-2 TaxID=2511171 RepID=UPI0010221C1B|nr:flagellar hook-associated protein 2 [Sporolactobacillus sp. THM19-2]RYL93651.1 flagellar hook-associated protein 2 [Sporolactobacillus sp. THM19-2]
MADSTSGVSINSINSMIGSTNSNRVSGLASGIDVDSIMTQIMTAESQPMIQMQQQLQQTEWQRDDYRSINTLLSNLEDTIFPMKLQSSYLTKSATSSNDSIVSATATPNAGNTTYKLSNVEMAASASAVGGEITTNPDFDPDKSLASQSEFLGSLPESITFSITTYDENGKPITPDPPFSFDPGTTSLNDMLKTISDSNLGVNAFYDPFTHKIAMTRKETGKLNPNGSDIEFSGDFITNTLKMTSTDAKFTDGSDAKFTINGLDTHRHSNTFTVGGVTYTLQGNTAPGETATVRVDNDTEAVFKKITDFVDQYNDTIAKINDKISEKRYRDYPPLTDLQKSEMKDSDIENWTNRAKSGMLASDSILTGALAQMRQDIYSSVSGTGNDEMDQLAEIGITTSTDYLEHGKLVVDEAKLREAISTDPQAVMNLFTKQGTTEADQGIMQRLDGTLKKTVDQIEEKAGKTSWVEDQYSMGRSINDMNERIAAFKLRLIDVENRYYAQFDAMEAAIQQANSQAGYLQQFMGQ